MSLEQMTHLKNVFHTLNAFHWKGTQLSAISCSSVMRRTELDALSYRENLPLQPSYNFLFTQLGITGQTHSLSFHLFEFLEQRCPQRNIIRTMCSIVNFLEATLFWVKRKKDMWVSGRATGCMLEATHSVFSTATTIWSPDVSITTNKSKERGGKSKERLNYREWKASTELKALNTKPGVSSENSWIWLQYPFPKQK